MTVTPHGQLVQNKLWQHDILVICTGNYSDCCTPTSRQSCDLKTLTISKLC